MDYTQSWNGTPHYQTITPDEATFYLNACAYPRQRAMRSHWIAELADVLQKGRWAVTSLTFAHCLEDGKVYLVDGYHRLSACRIAEMEACFLVTTQECKTMKDVNVLYGRLDRSLPRTIADNLIARDLPTETGIDLSFLRRAVGAVAIIKAGFHVDPALTRKRSYDQRFDDIAEYTEELRIYSDAIAGSSSYMSRRMKTAPVVAVALTLIRYQPEKATAFFKAVASGASLEENSGEHRMREDIVIDTTPIKKDRVGVTCRRVALCWNASFEHRPLTYLRVMRSTRPIVLRGTPYTEEKAQIGAG